MSPTEIQKYRKKLAETEQDLMMRLQGLGKSGREQVAHDPLDPGDESVFSQFREDLFAQTDRLRRLLDTVREALQRVDEGTYGECMEDGDPIEKARLEAIPWAAYCVRHQSMLDERAAAEQGARASL